MLVRTRLIFAFMNICMFVMSSDASAQPEPAGSYSVPSVYSTYDAGMASPRLDDRPPPPSLTFETVTARNKARRAIARGDRADLLNDGLNLGGLTLGPGARLNANTIVIAPRIDGNVVALPSPRRP